MSPKIESFSYRFDNELVRKFFCELFRKPGMLTKLSKRYAYKQLLQNS